MQTFIYPAEIEYRDEFGHPAPMFVCACAMWKLGPSGRAMLYYPCTASATFCPEGADACRTSCDHQVPFADFIESLPSSRN